MQCNGRLNKLTEKIIEITPTPAGSHRDDLPDNRIQGRRETPPRGRQTAARLAKVKSHAGGATLLAGLVLALGTAGASIAKRSASRKARHNSPPLSSSSLSAAPPRAFSTKAPAGFSLPYI